MARLTVLMPVYNAEKFLKKAIDSILVQTFTDFEFIIIDDGSTDRSEDIIRSYNDTRICFIKHETNQGITQTLNEGIKQASTGYIARMDADDISYPERLSKQFAYMIVHPDCALVSTLARVITEDEKFIRVDDFKSEHFYYNLTFFSWIYHPTVMYRKNAVEEVNLYTAPFSEDYELFWQLTRRYKFYNLPEVLLDYRETSQSLHRVTKKEEYEHAQQQQLMRNLRYYAGENYKIPLSYLECFRHNFRPLLAEKNVKKIVGCLRELDFITRCILAKENVNKEPEAIRKAAKYKRKYIISFFEKHLSLTEKIILLLQVESFRSLKKRVLNYIILII